MPRLKSLWRNARSRCRTSNPISETQSRPSTAFHGAKGLCHSLLHCDFKIVRAFTRQTCVSLKGFEVRQRLPAFRRGDLRCGKGSHWKESRAGLPKAVLAAPQIPLAKRRESLPHLKSPQRNAISAFDSASWCERSLPFFETLRFQNFQSLQAANWRFAKRI